MDKLAVDLWGASISAEGFVAIAAAVAIVTLLVWGARRRSQPSFGFCLALRVRALDQCPPPPSALSRQQTPCLHLCSSQLGHYVAAEQFPPQTKPSVAMGPTSLLACTCDDVLHAYEQP